MLTKSAEQFTEGLFHLTYRVYVDIVTVGVDATEIVFWDDDMVETEFCGFGYALFDTADGTHLATQAYLATHAPT